MKLIILYVSQIVDISYSFEEGAYPVYFIMNKVETNFPYKHQSLIGLNGW